MPMVSRTQINSSGKRFRKEQQRTDRFLAAEKYEQADGVSNLFRNVAAAFDTRLNGQSKYDFCPIRVTDSHAQ